MKNLSFIFAWFVGIGKMDFVYVFVFHFGVWIALLIIRRRMNMSRLRRLQMHLTTRLMPRGLSVKSSCFAIWIMKTLVSNKSLFFVLYVCVWWLNKYTLLHDIYLLWFEINLFIGSWFVCLSVSKSINHFVHML